MLISDINIDKHFAEEARLAASMSIWKMGDFFRLEDLCKIGLDGRNRYFRRTSWYLSANETRSEQMHVGFTTHLIQALYKEENYNVREAFRAPLLAFLLGIVRFLAKTQKFHDSLREIPQFASDWAAALTDTMGFIQMPDVDVGRCHKCGMVDPIRLDTMELMKAKTLVQYCSRCFPIHHLGDWTRDSCRITEAYFDRLYD